MARHALNELITTPVGGLGMSLAGGDVPVQEAKELINQPALRQLLVNYVDSNYAVNNADHNTWQTEGHTNMEKYYLNQNKKYPLMIINLVTGNNLTMVSEDYGSYRVFAKGLCKFVENRQSNSRKWTR